MNNLILYKFIIFCLVGLSGLALDLGATSILKEIIKINRYASNAIGFILAASSNYLLNRVWTFESQNTRIVAEYFSFFLISFFGLIISNLILWFLSEKIKWSFYISKITAICGVALWNFIMSILFVFSN